MWQKQNKKENINNFNTRYRFLKIARLKVQYGKKIFFRGQRVGGSGRNVHRLQQYFTHEKWKLQREKILQYSLAFHNALVFSCIYVPARARTHTRIQKIYETLVHIYNSTHTRATLQALTTVVYACRRSWWRERERERE